MKYTLGILLALLLTGCATRIKIESNKAPDFSEKISKLYILIKETDDAKAFMFPFTQGFEAHLTQKGIPFQEYFQDPLSLETDETVENKILEYGPNLVMVISQTQSMITQNNGGYNSGFNGGFGNSYGGGSMNRKITGGIFDIKFFKPGNKNPVWRGKIKAHSSGGIKKAGLKAYEIFIAKLVEDQLLNQ